MRDEREKNNPDEVEDLIIVGGGLVGATLALALEPHHRVIILEAQERPHPEHFPPSGERAIVLSAASKNILSALGLWSVLAPFVESVEEVQVSDRGRFGKVTITAKEENVPALGYVIQAKHLQAQLAQKLEERNNIEVFYQSQCQALKQDEHGLRVQFNTEEGLKERVAKLVVGADGQTSAVRSLLNIPVATVNYEQSAIVSNITLARSHQHVAYERFTSTGPLALLPLKENCSTLIWTLPQDKAKEYLSLSTEQFTEVVQEAFGYRLGRFLESTPPVAFPIVMHRASELVRDSAVLVGNAANAIHPIAGQGLNLGLRDVAVLAELLIENDFKAIDKTLSDYLSRRRLDHLQIINITHSLVGFFCNDFLPLALARNLGMMAMDCFPPIKRWLARRSLGQSGHVTPLACGVSFQNERAEV